MCSSEWQIFDRISGMYLLFLLTIDGLEIDGGALNLENGGVIVKNCIQIAICAPWIRHLSLFKGDTHNVSIINIINVFWQFVSLFYPSERF